MEARGRGRSPESLHVRAVMHGLVWEYFMSAIRLSRRRLVCVHRYAQERATKISHGNVGKLAAAAGDSTLARICARIAGALTWCEGQVCGVSRVMCGVCSVL